MQEKLQKYKELLIEYNQKFNLVAKGAMDDIERRHFADSAQLANFIPSGTSIIDMGSGAGFPSVILAIMGYRVVAIESIRKKADFLRLLKSELDLPIFTVENTRLESYLLTKRPGFVYTARAFASLSKILDYLPQNSRCFLLKGRSVMDEISDAQKTHKFNYELHPSETGDGFILIVNP